MKLEIAGAGKTYGSKKALDGVDLVVEGGLSGLLGMNVEGIPFAREPWAFWGVVAFCVLTGGAMGAWFNWSRWLQK